MPGSIQVSFAGTFAEAVEYCKDKPGLNAPKGLAHHGDDDGLPMLSWPYRNGLQLIEGEKTLTQLGWEPEFQIVQRYGPYTGNRAGRRK